MEYYSAYEMAEILFYRILFKNPEDIMLNESHENRNTVQFQNTCSTKSQIYRNKSKNGSCLGQKKE